MKLAVGPVESLPPGASLIVAIDDREVVVFNVDGDLVAIDNKCAHRGSSLAEGVVRNGIVTCPSHLWRYDVRSGVRSDAAGYQQASYAVTVEGDDVYVELPSPQPAKSMRDLLLEHARDWDRNG